MGVKKKHSKTKLLRGLSPFGLNSSLELIALTEG